MSFQTALLPGDAYRALRDNMPSWKAQAQNALAFIQANSIDTNYVFNLLDKLNGVITSINNMKVVAGLDTYATNQGYTGTCSADATATANAAQACINWVVTNFPTDTGGFIQAFKLNSGDGSRIAAVFTPAQTGGLQTSLSNLIATIQ